MENEVQEKIEQIQVLQQNLENFASQRQQFQLQETEIETALSEIDSSEKTYKIIGSIMVQMDREKLRTNLEEKREMLNIRIKSIEKQEEKIREKAEEIQKEVLRSLETSKPKKNSTAKENDTK